MTMGAMAGWLAVYWGAGLWAWPFWSRRWPDCCWACYMRC